MHLLRNMGGMNPPNNWKGALNVSYKIGPGFTDTFKTQKVRMNIHTNNQVTRIYNVIGRIRGAQEPDRYVILGGHRDAWVFGGIDPMSGAAVVHEAVRSAGKLLSNGMYTLRVDCTPSLHTLVYDLTKQIASPEEGEEGVSLYDSWHKRDNWTSDRDAPRISKLGSGLIFQLADSQLLPLDANQYAGSLRKYALSISQLAQVHPEEMKLYGVTFVVNFTVAARDFHERLQTLNRADSLQVRMVNDQLMYLERAFIDPLGLPGRPFYRHLIFAPSSHNKYAGESFPGIYDSLFDIENSPNQQQAWQEVKRQISIAAFTVHAAAMTLTQPA
ncbi:hypothetical protein CRUP_028347 [Coryphaenoides rupestris]|nr:hypothetical protein CRUP_028347 [Coryphaenoides rupestris]